MKLGLIPAILAVVGSMSLAWSAPQAQYAAPAASTRFPKAETVQPGAAAANATEPGDMIYSRPGQIAPAGDGARLNLYCQGTGSPTVVFDSGWGDWAPAWAVVQPRIAQFTRACSYDRAGSGFSDPGPLPRTTARIAEELHGALHAAGVTGPYILVGSAFGGDHVRAFADLYMQEVAGLVLVDADASDVASAAMRREDDGGDLAYVVNLTACRDAIAEGKPLPLMASAHGRPPANCAQQAFYRGLPEAEWSPGLNAKLIEIAQNKVPMWDAVISEMQNMPADELWLQKHRRSLGARPLRVLTSGNHAVGHLETQRPTSLKHLKYEYDVAVAQSRWLALSSNARQVFTSHSSEYIQFDEPDVVVDAVHEVYGQNGGHGTLAQQDADRPGAAGSVFRECPDCPEMVVIPAGEFTMGSSDAEKGWAVAHGATPKSVSDEAPQHTVRLKSFAFGKYDVTRAEFAAFVQATGYRTEAGCYETGNPHSPLLRDADWQNPGFSQTDRDPVICVDWNDAHAYAAWLNMKLTGKSDGPYRLASEAEWEYAARGGTSTKFWWGEDDGTAAEYTWFRDNAGGTTHPVGLKPANPFGLNDISGNVWQWVEDCYADTESYAGVPTDGSAAQGKSDCLRSDRSGSWSHPSWLLRAATRERNPAGYRDREMSFRMARTLP